MPSLSAPNVDNYFVGKGVVMIKPEGQDHYSFLGNVPEFEFSPSLETLDHFSSQAGVRSKDKTVILSKGGELRMVMEELTARNLALFLLSDVDLSDPDIPTLEIFSANAKSAAVKFIGTNEVGPRWNFEFAKVDFIPSGSFNPISDEWGNLEVTGQLSQADGTFGIAYITNLNNEGVPINTALPTITGEMEEGQTLTADEGTWLNYAPGSITYAYQWYADGDPIVSATEKTYVLTSSEVGKIITVKVTAANVNGSAEATSEPGPDDVTT